ncbi:threonine--tRNA ligase [Desulfovibrionales bacterium]
MIVDIAIQDKSITFTLGITCAEALNWGLSGNQLKVVLACQAELEDGSVLHLDLGTCVPVGCRRLIPISEDSQKGIEFMRHSAAHIMATAVSRLFSGVKIALGPAIEHGFYYDFDTPKPFTPDDLSAIESEMRKVVAEDQPFVREILDKAAAFERFVSLGETYKLEILDGIGANKVSIYTNGHFVDLCRGPHLVSTGQLRAFTLTSVASVYWRGDESRPMLQRIYGTAFPNDKAFKKYFYHLEEVARRDHRKLGAQLDLFSFHNEAGAGMVVWHPKGALIRTILEDFERKEHLRRGYQVVQGPQLLRRELWERSGHYDNYRDNMYFTEIDGQDYGIKPMNCLAHMFIYRSRLRSYRDLPLRFFELGVVHRHEKSGVLHGLLRARQFTQDDAHILCRPDQLLDEIMSIISFVQDVMSIFGFEYNLELSTRPEKSIGSDEDWERATTVLTQALSTLGMPFIINAGDGAFYGPKIDVKLKDALGRRWQCATIQCDFTLPERFDLYYVDVGGERRRPVMLHRVILGAVERFLGMLIEHYAGAFPVWLAPVQVRILTVTDAQNIFVGEVCRVLSDHGLRVEVDIRNEKLGFKVREAQLEKIPYILVAGDKEVAAGGVNIRLQSGENLGLKTLSATVALILAECEEPFKRGGMRYNFCTAGQCQP